MSRPIPPRRSTFVRRAPIRPLHGYVLPVLVLGTFLLPLAPFGLEHPVPVPSPHLPAPPRWTPEFRPASLPEYQVDGNLAGIGLSGAPGPALVGAEVDLLARPCEGFDACPFLESTLTQAPSGNFSLRTVPGDYFLITNRTSAFGGTEAVLNLTNSSGGEYGPVELRAEPFVPYANVSFQLPAWNNLSDTAANCNAMLPCQTGGPAPPYGTQQPILSWTSDGVFYVNLSDELVFYNFENRSVRAIADWLPLYDDLMAYQGIENTEFLTVDGSYVYEFGCAHVCTPASTVEFFAVNTTTGRSFSTTVNSTDAGDFQTNGQVDLIGENGNLSIAAFVQSDGVVLGFDLWNDSQWTLGVLPFFEANNLYWIPAWGSYLDVQSAQATPQHIDQIRLDGPAPGAALDVASNLTGSPYFPVNGVNGLVYNLSAQSFTFTSQYVAGTALTYRADLSEGGTLQSLRPIWGTTLSKFGIWPNTSAYPNVASSEHRPTMILSGPAFAGFGNGWFENRSAMVDPGTGVWVDTNVSFDHPTGGNKSFRQTGPSPASMEGLFYNTSYALLPGSYDCRTNGTSCPIRGNVAPSVSTGTVWWSWRAGLPEFPFPASAPIAEVAPPAAPTGLGLSFTLSHLDVRWNASTTPASELLGYQLTYGPTRGGPYRSAWVPANRTQTSLGPVSTGREYVVELFAWNLHGRSAGLVGTGPSSVPLGWLNLTVAPFDANVTLDQIPVSLTGGITALPLAFGSYWVNATAPGYTPLSEVVNISLTTGRSLDLDLVGILPELAGSIFPSTAHLYVDGAGVNLSANGSFQLLLSEGAHAISANAPGYFPILRWNLSLSFGEHLVEHVRLNRSYGWLVGTVSPPNASAVLSGVPVNLTGGHLLLRLPTQSYWLNLTDPGHHPVLLGPLNVTALNTTNFSAVLLPYSGTLQLTVNPPNASILLDNQTLTLDHGAASSTLPAGPHEIDARAPGYDPQRLVERVPSNGSVFLNLSLLATRGWIEGRVAPIWANLSIDATRIGIDGAGSYNVSVAPGTHTVEVRAVGYSSIDANLSVGAHAGQWANFTLVRDTPGVISSGWTPWTIDVLGAAIGGTCAVAAAVLLRWHRGPRSRPEPTSPPRR